MQNKHFEEVHKTKAFSWNSLKYTIFTFKSLLNAIGYPSTAFYMSKLKCFVDSLNVKLTSGKILKEHTICIHIK